jgi:DNA-binding MarR family transcriptional regulator
MKYSPDQNVPVPDGAAASPAMPEQIVAELAPWLAAGRRRMAQSWCMRQLSMTHLHVLLLLQIEGALSMSRLAEMLDVSMPNATGIVGRMEERGLVERLDDERDRRRVLVALTQKGRDAIEEMDVTRREHLGRILAELTPEQQANCLRAVRDIRAAAERLDSERDSTPPTPPTPTTRGLPS